MAASAVVVAGGHGAQPPVPLLFAAAMVHLPTASVVISLDVAPASGVAASASSFQTAEVTSGSSSVAGSASSVSARSRASSTSAAGGRSDAASAMETQNHHEQVPALKPMPPMSQRPRAASVEGRLSTARQRVARSGRRASGKGSNNANSQRSMLISVDRVPSMQSVIRTICTLLKLEGRSNQERFVHAA